MTMSFTRATGVPVAGGGVATASFADQRPFKPWWMSSRVSSGTQ